MSFISHVSVIILTFNEAPNINRTLFALKRFKDVIVLDSGSTDETTQIVNNHNNTRLITRDFDCHQEQWTYALTQCGIETPWVLALDADYVLPDELVEEMAVLTPASDVAGYRTNFLYSIYGRTLSATLYPPVVTLYRRAKAHYIQEGHTHRVVIDGNIENLRNKIDHDDRKPLSRWLSSQINYAKLEADHILSMPKDKLRRMDRIRRTGWIAPLIILPFTLLIKRCLFDGWPGWLYALQRTLAETLIAIEIVDRRFAGKDKSQD